MEPVRNASGPRPDTIVALSTAPGVGAVAVVRISGPDTLEILAAVAPDLAGPPEPRRAGLTRLVDPASDEVVDRGLVTFFPGPDSYTGEDVAEISGHGGWLAPGLVVDACVRAGSRPAEAGEFTRRAYLNGKMDLIQAEAVLDLVEGRNRALHGAALHQLERGLSRRIADLRQGLVRLEALLIHHLDFPDEDEAPVPMETVVREARRIESGLADLVETAPEGELLREGALTVLAGRPNSGKSSLFNALLGKERAIVTDIPGTTRDALEATVSLGGFPFRLVDTAGLRETVEEVERLGIEVARRYLDAADLVLFCAEAGRPLEEEERRFLEGIEGPAVLVRTKADRVGAGGEEGGEALEDRAMAGGIEGVRGPFITSVETGEGLARLRKFLPELVYRGLVVAGVDIPVLTRKRQTRAVGEALREVRCFADALEDGVPAEMASTHLRPAETALEEVLGVISPEEVLDHLFAEFCIGK